MERFQVIDADGHVEESAASLQKYLKKENRGRPLWTSDAWDRDFGKTLGKTNEDPRVQLADMDVDGIDVQVIYPTRGISLSAAREIGRASCRESEETSESGVGVNVEGVGMAMT